MCKAGEDIPQMTFSSTMRRLKESKDACKA